MRCRIGDLCTTIGSGGTPSRKNKSYYVNGTIKWLKTKELKDQNIFDTEEYITEEALKNSSAKIYPKDTVCMAMYGATVGKLGILKNEATTNQACCNMVVDKNKADYQFLFYSLLFNRENLISLANGAAQQNLNKGIIEDYKINYFNLKEQKAIAHILSTLDEKIETNNQINKTLEKMAQTLFKHWFVDFEFPDENGDPYKSSGGEMVESELGMIPKGWEVKTIGDLIEVVSKGTTPRKIDIVSSLDNRTIKFIKVKDIGDDGIINLANIELIPNSIHLNQLRRSILHYKDILISIAGTIGRISYVNNELVNSNINQAISFVRLKDIEKHFLLLINKVKSIEFRDSIMSKVVQGVQANISLTVIKGEKLIISDDKVLNSYNNIMNNIFNEIEVKNKENQTLTNLRDLLLPKLMSGEIRVPIEEGDIQ